MFIPVDIPSNKKKDYQNNMQAITHNTDRIFLFAGDQKIEHLHADFFGMHLPKETAHPQHLFEIAQKGNIGAFATQLGLIARYAHFYKKVNYIAKLNSKTNISSYEPLSRQLWTVSNVIQLQKEARIPIRGVGYTIYLGSEHEASMLREAAQIIWQAHQEGLVTILWIYPRGKSVKSDDSLAMLTGAAGVANALGADVVKIKSPQQLDSQSIIEQLHQIKQAAGNTKVICSGGSKVESSILLKRIEAHIKNGGIDGAAIGRNVFQQSLDEALGMTQALAKIIYE